VLNRRKQLLLAGLALLVVFAFVYATRERDPVYKDRRLSEYLGEVHGIGLGWGSMNQIDPGIVLDYTRPGKTEASDAVLSVGTNALPMLVRLLGIRESRTTFGTNASGAIPLLMQSLGSTNGEVAAASAVALARIGGPPDRVVPIILENLPKSNASPRTAMSSSSAQFQRLMNDRNIIKNVFALGEYGRHASHALPRLLALESYPDAHIRQAAREAAAKINGNTNSVQR